MTVNKKEFLTFELGKEEYAVEIMRVQEIRGWENPDPLPNVPSYVKGDVDLRGTIVPIIDLREKFGLKVSYNVTTVVVVVHVFTKQGERIMGLVVDSVSDVQQFDVDKLQPAPDISASIDRQSILGLTTVFERVPQQDQSETAKKPKGRMVILIDIDKLASEGLIEQMDMHEDHMPMGNG